MTQPLSHSTKIVAHSVHQPINLEFWNGSFFNTERMVLQYVVKAYFR